MLATAQPLPLYCGLDGKPLTGGCIYFGVPGQNPETSPIPVYWDAAGTQPAAQPIRTLNGYPVRAGAPASVYVSGSYSLTVRDAKRKVVISTLNADFLAGDLASPAAGKGINLIGANPILRPIARMLGAWLYGTANIVYYGADPSGTEDSTAAIREAAATGLKVITPRGRFLISGEIEAVHAGQEFEWLGTGGYAYGEDVGLNWEPNARWIVKGSLPRRDRTRRLHRASAADPKDPPLSVALNVQAEGVILRNPAIDLYCDYTDTSHTNLGDDCDIGIGVFTRVGVQIHNPQITGYFRRGGIYVDVTNATGLPRFNSLSGAPYPTGTVQNGADGLHIWNPYIRGPIVGLAILGAKPAAGYSTYGPAYYDEISGVSVADARGTFGCSDVNVFGGRIYGPDHHSNRRIKDPVLVGGVIGLAGMLLEPDNAPAAVYIDGMAGNSSGCLWGMNFWGTRIATFEAFRMRLGKAYRIRLNGAHVEGRGGNRMNTAGAIIDTNNYTTTSYGDIAGTTYSGRVSFLQSARNDNQTTSNGAHPHFYGDAFTLTTDSGRIFPGDYIASQGKDLDFRVPSGYGHLFRSDNGSLLLINNSSVHIYDLPLLWTTNVDIRSGDASLIYNRIGNVVKSVLQDGEFRLIDGKLRFGGGSGPVDIGVEASPEGLVTAPPGSTARWPEGPPGARFWSKDFGTGNTGWTARW